MKKSLNNSVRSFFTEPNWEKLRNVFWFCLITFVFHVLWRIWANTFQFAPIESLVTSVRSFFVHQLYNEVTYILKHILNITITTEPHIIITKNSVRLFLGESASGFKQVCQFVILILFFKGQWKQKAWFIPIGIIILHLTNVFRIICLVVIAMHWPQQIQYAHDNWLRILYYVIIFGLWLVWVERIASTRKPNVKQK